MIEEIVKNLAALKAEIASPEPVLYEAVLVEPEVSNCHFEPLIPAPEPVLLEPIFVEPEISNCPPILAPEPVLLEPVLLEPVFVKPEISNCLPIPAPEPVLLEPVLVEPEVSNCPPIYAPEMVVPEPVPEPEATRGDEVSDFEIIGKDELNMSDTEKNESEVTVIENRKFFFSFLFFTKIPKKILNNMSEITD